MTVAPPQAASPALEPKSLSPVAVVVGFTMICASFTLNAMDRQIFFPLLPHIREDFGFSLERGGLLATGFTLGLAIAGFCAGFLLDRFSRKSVLVVSITAYSVATVAVPFSTGFADMALYRLLSGVGEGIQATAIFAVVGSYFFHRRALAAGFVGVAFGAGVFLGPLVGIPLATASGDWRTPFYFFGIAGLVMAMVIALVASRRMTDTVTGRTSVDLNAFDHVPLSLYNRNVIGFGLACAAGGLAIYGYLGLYPTFLVEQLGFGSGQVAKAMSMFGFGAMMALPAGWLGDRMNQKWLLVAALAGFALTAYLTYHTTTSASGQYALAFLMGALGSGVIFVNSCTAMQRSVRPERVARGQGMFMLAYYVPAAFSGLLFARLVNASDWGGASVLQLSLVPILGLLAVLMVDSRQMIHR
jgi:MFS family permease